MIMARTVETIQAEIDQLKAVLATGASSVTSDKGSATYRSRREIDLSISRLQDELAALTGGRKRRRVRLAVTRGGF